ncbi:MAG: hypothetical protein QOD68_256 [Actinomycetota bacterium]|nr:hypothetical protein [Actinomycetota bacterium]
MIVSALVLLLLAAAAPMADRPLRRIVADPVLPVAVLAAALLAAAAALAAAADDVSGWQRAVAAVLGVLVAVTAGSHVVRAVFRLTRREVRPGRPGAVPAAAAPPGATAPTGELPLDLESPVSVLRGGAWIGYLERGAVAATLLASFPEGLALVLAVKGVGRYPELRDAGSGGRAGADAPEEFIIGTLASLLWAAAAAGTAALLR